MEIRDYIRIVRERWVILVIALLSGTLVAAVFTYLATPIYTSTSQVYVSVQLQDGSASSLNQGSAFSQNQVAGFAELAVSPLVLQPVVEELGLNASAGELAQDVVAINRTNTPLIDITVSGTDPAAAAQISNAIATSMSQALPELQRPIDQAVSPIRITLTRAAEVPSAPSEPRTSVNLALGAFLGLSLGAAGVIIQRRSDTRLRTPEDLARTTDAAVLGTINFDRDTDAQPLAMVHNPRGPRAEAIRRVRTNLQFVSALDDLRCVVVTSSLPAEGKSTSVTNLALALADSGVRTILVDADLRRPRIAATFGVEPAIGLTSVLVGRVNLNDAIQPWADTGLDLLVAGEIPPNPSELLGSAQMQAILSSLRSSYDVVLIDTAPLLPVTDGAVLASISDGVVVVVAADSTHRHHVRAALESLSAVDARVLGLVLNRSAAGDERGNQYGYEYLPVDDRPTRRGWTGRRGRPAGGGKIDRGSRST